MSIIGAIRRASTVIILVSTLCLNAMAQWDYSVPFPKPISHANDTVTMTFIGDVMMHTKQLDYDCSAFLERLAPITRDADISVANLEFSLGGKPYTGYPAFSTPDTYAIDIASKGVDVFLTANNHILDRGSEGLKRTLKVYGGMHDSLGIQFTGTALKDAMDTESNPLIVVGKGIRIALVNFTYGTNGFKENESVYVSRMDKDNVGAMIESAKQRGADFIIALPHWGLEYELKHSAEQQRWAEWLVGQGVDLIVGGHPHVVQDTTHINGVPVIYSMGNAVSNMSATNTRLELAVTARFVRQKDDSLVMLEPQLEFLWCTLPGKLIDNYTTIRVAEYLGRRDEWISESDYDNMVSTLKRVKEATGIE